MDFKNNESKWDCLIAIADIYRKGSFPRYLPNEEMAIRCYKIAAQCPNGDIAGLAQIKYIEARTERISNEDKQGAKIPIEYGTEAYTIAENRIISTHWSLFEKPKMQKKSKDTDNRRNIRNENIDENHNPGERLNFFDQDINQIFNINNIDNTLPTEVYKNDPQNVHDHGVISISKKNLESITEVDNINNDIG